MNQNQNICERLKPRGWLVPLAFAVAAMQGCSVGPTATAQPVSYDFGPPSALAPQAQIKPAILVPEVVAPAWMETPAIFYRLAYRDAAQPRAYSNSRWVMPPALLLTNRLRQRLTGAAAGGVVVPSDGIRAPYTLRLEIEDFVQVFDSEAKSRAVLRARASLLNSRALAGQRTFTVDVPTATPDAEGGARALTTASEQLIEQLVSWTAGQVK